MNTIPKLKLLIALLAIGLFLTNCQNNDEAASDSATSEEMSVDEKMAAEVPVKEVKVSNYSDEALIKLGMDVTQTIPRGLEMGTKAPVFRGTDQNGNTVTLKEKLADGPVVLVFYRGYWCGVCNRYLSAFSDSLSMVQDKGASVIAVAPEVAENAKKMIDKTGFDVPVISDSDLRIMNAYGVNFHVTQAYQDKIVNYAGSSIPEMNGMEDAFLPVPATYIINQAGMISYAQFDPNYRKRASVEDILAAL